jgi:protein-disulfide isomerase
VPEHSPTATSRNRDVVLLAIAMVILVAIVSFLVVRHQGADKPLSGASTSSTTPSAIGAAPAGPLGPLGDLARRQVDDPMAQGSVTAPVTLIEFADFRCPFCAQFMRTTEPVLIASVVRH